MSFFKTYWYLIAFLLLNLSPIKLAAQSPTDAIVFKKNNEVLQTLTLQKIKKLGKEKTLEVWEPHENKLVRYIGISTNELLTQVYGEEWKKSELLLFVCADGYKAPVPTSFFESELSLLAYKKVGAPFTVNNLAQNQNNIKLGPYYLVWNNKNNAQIKLEGGSNWPYQIIGIELAQFASKFPHMILKDSAPQEAQRGFVAFQKYCMTCHKIKGDGGDKGPELIAPISITTRKDYKTYLTKMMLNPLELNPKATMPPLNPNVKEKEKMIADIISYLEEISK